MRAEKIVWRDHYSRSGWRYFDGPKENFDEDQLVTSYGHVLAETKKYVVLAQSVATTHQYADTMHIMKSSIKSRTRVR